MKVIIASKNPVKINAVENAFQQIFPSLEFSFEGAASPSGVSDQPMDSAETLLGAQNRVHHVKSAFPNAAYWVGIEGGVEKKDQDMEVFAWVVIHSKDQKGKAQTGTFFLPKKVVELIDQGIELGEADDIIFRKSNSKQKSGAVGILTNDVIDRTAYYVNAVVLALIPFNNKELY